MKGEPFAVSVKLLSLAGAPWDLAPLLLLANAGKLTGEIDREKARLFSALA